MATQPASTTIRLAFSRTDANAIKANTALASLASETYLSVTSATIQDTNANTVEPIPTGAAIFVRQYTPDETGPSIESYDLDYDSGVLTMYLDETVNLATLDPTAITFQSASSLGGSSHTLVDSTGLDTGLLAFTRIQLSNRDLNELKRLRICVSSDSCFLSAATSMIEDVPGNQNTEIEGTSPLAVSNYILDTTAPRVVDYTEFDLNSGTFTLEFSETVEASTLNMTEVELHDSYINTTFIFSFEELTAATDDNYVMIFQLGVADQNRLKLNTEFCTHESNCWIRFSSDFISDVLGNPVVPILPDTIDTFHLPGCSLPIPLLHSWYGSRSTSTRAR